MEGSGISLSSQAGGGGGGGVLATFRQHIHIELALADFTSVIVQALQNI